MERLRSPILFVLLMLLPFFLYFTGWRYWWGLQIITQLVLCLVGLFYYPWRFVAVASLFLLIVCNFSWFYLNPLLPPVCQKQIDDFTGIAESDSQGSVATLRLHKVEFWCRGEFRRWPTAELKISPSRLENSGWFRTGDRIQLRNITITARNSFALDIEPVSRFRIFNASYRDKALSRSGLLIYIQKKARYYLSPFTYSVYKALITADRTSLTKNWKHKISQLGITHLFAISGMHIGILFLWLSLVLRWIISFPSDWIGRGSGVFFTDLVSILVIFVFLIEIGMPVSAERSFIMLVWWGAMRHFLGWQPLWFILCGTAVIILVESPVTIGQISFQLSFLSVAGIIQILPLLPLRRLQDSRMRVFLKLILASLMVSLWLFILTMPLVSGFTDSFSMITAFNNVVHIFYLSFLFLPCALLVTFFTLAGYFWNGFPFEVQIYTCLDILGGIWKQMLHLNDFLNQYFLVSHFSSWGVFPVLAWCVLFGLPFIITGYLRRRK